MKEQVKSIFEKLPVEARAIYYPMYLSVQDAIERGDHEVIDRIVKTIPNGGEAWSEQVTKAVDGLYALTKKKRP